MTLYIVTFWYILSRNTLTVTSQIVFKVPDIITFPFPQPTVSKPKILDLYMPIQLFENRKTVENQTM